MSNDTPLSRLAVRYAFDDGALASFTGGFSPADWNHRVNDETNHAQWLLGHLAGTRRWIVRTFFDGPEPQEWEALFGMGAKPCEASDAIPVASLLEAFTEAGAALCHALESATADEADAPMPDGMSDFPDGGKDVAGAVSFLTFHEAYHIGQIGLLRRCVDKPGLF